MGSANASHMGFSMHQEVLQPVTLGLEVDPTATAPPEAVLQGPGSKIAGRSLVQTAILAPVMVSLFGHPPNEFHQELINADTQVPIKPFGGISSSFLFGIEPVNGRDLFSRVLYGSQISLLIAFLATLLSVVIGAVKVGTQGYFGGR